MFERFTERARQVVVLAQHDARALGHNYIGTEHLLLGLLREEQGLGARVLVALGVTVEGTREQVARIVGMGDESGATGQIPFTPRAKRTLELALRESLALGHDYIGTEHVLLGLIAGSDGVAAQILADAGVKPGDVRGAVLAMLEGRPLPSRDHTVMVSTASKPPRDWTPVLAAGVWCAIGLAVGVLLGWAIWGS
jgi:ATP-dependent Clp protease ATP-binding subunit ClpC